MTAETAQPEGDPEEMPEEAPAQEPEEEPAQEEDTEEEPAREEDTEEVPAEEAGDGTEKMTLSSTDFTLFSAGSSYQLQVTGAPGACTFASSDPKVATVAADGTVTAVEGDLLRVDTPAGKLLTRGSGFAVGEEMHVSIRPEYLEAGERSADGFDLPARIKDFTYMGTVVKTALDMADGTELKLSRFEQDANAHEGDKVYLSWRPEKSVPIKKSHT